MSVSLVTAGCRFQYWGGCWSSECICQPCLWGRLQC